MATVISIVERWPNQPIEIQHCPGFGRRRNDHSLVGFDHRCERLAPNDHERWAAKPSGYCNPVGLVTPPMVVIVPPAPLLVKRLFVLELTVPDTPVVLNERSDGRITR